MDNSIETFINRPPDNTYNDGHIISWDFITPRGNLAGFGSVDNTNVLLKVVVSDSGEIVSLSGDNPLILTFTYGSGNIETQMVVLTHQGDAVHIPGGATLTIETEAIGAEYIVEYPNTPVNPSLPLIEHDSNVTSTLAPGEVMLEEIPLFPEDKPSYRIFESPTIDFNGPNRVYLEVFPDKTLDVLKLSAANLLTIDIISGRGKLYLFNEETKKLRVIALEQGVSAQVDVGEIYCLEASDEGLVVRNTCPGIDGLHVQLVANPEQLVSQCILI